jgi:inner membrane protein
MSSLVPYVGNWFWLIAAGLLLFMELILPGVFLIWLACAAATVGIVSYFFDLSWQVEAALFAGFAMVYVYLAAPWYSKVKLPNSDQPNLNQRIYSYVGKSYTLSEAIIDGQGKLNIEGARWDIIGPDLPAGSHVKVISVEGMKLRVAAA